MLSKETTEKDRSLKTQLLIANSNSEVKEPPERVSHEQLFFGVQRGEMNISKVDFWRSS